MRKKGFKYELGRYELSTSRYRHVSLFKKNRRKQVSNGFEGFYRKIRSLNLRISKVLAECGNEIYSLETFLITETCLDIARKEARFLEWFRVAPFFSSSFEDISWILRQQVTFLATSIRAHRPFYCRAIRKISYAKKKKKEKRKRVDPRNTEIQIFDAVPRPVFDRESLATLLFQTQIRFTIYYQFSTATILLKNSFCIASSTNF